MSNKPKIYAYCSAGCKWETIHKSDVPAKYIYLTKEEYDKLTEYEDDVMYFVYDEGYVFTEAEHAKKADSADSAGNAQRAAIAVEVSELIKGLPITDIFQNFDEESGELTNGTVKNASKATYADFTDFSNNKTWREIELTHDGSYITSLSVNKTYYMCLRITNDSSNFLVNYGVVHIPSHLESGKSNQIYLTGIMGAHTYVVHLIVNGDYSDEDKITAWFYLDNTMTPNHATLRFKEIR